MVSEKINPGIKGMRLDNDFHSFNEVISNEQVETYKKAADIIGLIAVEIIVDSGREYIEEQEDGSLQTRQMGEDQKEVRVTIIQSEDRLTKFWIAVDDIKHQQQDLK